MARGQIEKWPWPVGPESPDGFIKGGYIRKGVYCVQRTLGGVRYDRSLGQTEPKAAYDELLRFKADPKNWRPLAPPAERVGVFLDKTLLEDFLSWSREVKKNSVEWRTEQKRVLVWWGQKREGDPSSGRLAGVGLRNLTVRDHVEPALRGVPSAAKAQRIRILKSLYGWMLEKEYVDRNPLARKLREETKIRPAQWKKLKAIPIERAAEAFRYLVPKYQDALIVNLATGWHEREVSRFAEGGSIDALPEGREAEGAAVILTPRTKAGNPLRTIVHDAAASAARRLRERGELSPQLFRRAVEAACETTALKAGRVPTKYLDADGKIRPELRKDRAKFLDVVDGFFPSWARHTVATYAENHGADPAAAARFLNHGSTTTSRFYSTHALPKKVPTPEAELLRRALLKVVPAG